MRLADEIAQAVNGPEDQITRGAISSFAQSLARAECFEISQDVAVALKTLHSLRPSALIAAIPFSHPPFPHTWVEWVAPEINVALGRSGNLPEFEFLKNNTLFKELDRPMPERVGALIEDIGIPGLASVTWAWSQKGHGINISNLSVMMGWALEGLEQFKALVTDPKTQPFLNQLFGPSETRHWIDLTADAAKTAAAQIPGWHPHRNNPAEIQAIIDLGKWERFSSSHHCVNFQLFLLKNLPMEKYMEVAQTWLADLSGEPWFIRAFLVSLNTKNGVVSTREDFSKLNRAREKAGKRKLREFQITRLNLSRHAARATGQNRITREQARQHYVRGHFKVRKTGVYWWSPFVRGTSQIAVPRERYVVVA